MVNYLFELLMHMEMKAKYTKRDKRGPRKYLTSMSFTYIKCHLLLFPTGVDGEIFKKYMTIIEKGPCTVLNRNAAI